MVSVAPEVRSEAVTSDEIRRIGSRTDSESKFVGLFLREIAAQLAEQNQQIRDDRLQRKVWRDEDQIANKARDAMMTQITGMQQKLAAPMDQIANKARDAMMTQITGMQQKLAAPMIAPAVRVDFPGTVQHLGCIIREPDGAYKIATNQGGLLELSEADFQRIFAPPIESKA